MSQQTSLIQSEIDYDRDGKQTGFLRLPYSVHRSAYGWIPVPIVMFKNGAGPTALMMSGNHGDEYEGQIALTKLSQSLAAGDIQGRLIILPMANYPAAHAGLRTSPFDAGNLNRSFPGDPQGTPTEMIAHYIEEILMPCAIISSTCIRAAPPCAIPLPYCANAATRQSRRLRWRPCKCPSTRRSVSSSAEVGAGAATRGFHPPPPIARACWA